MKRIGTTSFIKPAGRLANVQYLKGLVDEVELLYMASTHEMDMPDEKEIEALSVIDIRYNIHMPYDRDLRDMREWEFMAGFAKMLRPLKAATHTFHIQPEQEFFDGLEWFIKETVLPVTLENGCDDAEVLYSMPETKAGVCLDVGHMVLHGQDVAEALEKLDDKIEMFHLHGVHKGKDHKSIRHLDTETLKAVLRFADEKGLTVSLEVFNEKDLTDSLLYLKNITF